MRHDKGHAIFAGIVLNGKHTAPVSIIPCKPMEKIDNRKLQCRKKSLSPGHIGVSLTRVLRQSDTDFCTEMQTFCVEIEID